MKDLDKVIAYHHLSEFPDISPETAERLVREEGFEDVDAYLAWLSAKMDDFDVRIKRAQSLPPLASKSKLHDNLSFGGLEN